MMFFDSSSLNLLLFEKEKKKKKKKKKKKDRENVSRHVNELRKETGAELIRLVSVQGDSLV